MLPASSGTALLAYDSLSAIAVGLAEGAERIDLVVQDKPPVEDPLAGMADALDVSVVSVRRVAGAVVKPSDDMPLAGGDTLVLAGQPEQLALAEAKLLALR